MVVDLGTTFYFHKENSGGMLMGMSDSEESSSFDTRVDWNFLEKIVERALHRAPILEEAEVNRGWAGLYAISPDNNAILGEIPELENFICTIGFSGHGFMHAPAVGIGIADLIAEGRYQTVDLSPLGIERLYGEIEVGEQNVI